MLFTLKIKAMRDLFIESFYQDMKDPYEGMNPDDWEEDYPRKLDLSKIDNIEFDDVDMGDYPDFCDTYIVSADMKGIPMCEEELEELNKNHGFVYEKLIDKLF